MSQIGDHSRTTGLTTGRLEALSDGVLAIVITLLVLGFADAEKGLSDRPDAACAELVAFLLGLWPHLLGYVLSFVLIAIYWIVHHTMFHHIRRADRGLLWLNVLFLMSVAFLPFPTDLLAEFIWHESNVIVVLFGVSHAIAGLSLAGVWWYATHGRRLVSAELSPEIIRGTMVAALVGPALNVLGAAISYWSIPAGICIFALAPLMYVVPREVDKLWSTKEHREAEQEPRPVIVRELIGQSRPWPAPPQA